MFKIGDIVENVEYGEGEVTSIKSEQNTAVVRFEKESWVVTGEIIDKDHHFEDNRELEKNKFIEVPIVNLERVANCFSCGQRISGISQDKCNWINFDCDSCGCDYMKKG